MHTHTYASVKMYACTEHPNDTSEAPSLSIDLKDPWFHGQGLNVTGAEWK